MTDERELAVRRRNRWQQGALLVAGALLVLFLLAPVAGLVFTTGASELLAGLGHPLVWPALRLSALTTAASLVGVVLLGTPLAWVLSRARSRAARLIEALVQLPVVIPPAVAGVALLLAFGRRGLLSALYPPGFGITFTSAAVVLAQIFVSAPFYVQAALSAFRRIDPRLLIVARSFGAGPLRVFARIALPLAAPGLIAGQPFPNPAISWSGR